MCVFLPLTLSEMKPLALLIPVQEKERETRVDRSIAMKRPTLGLNHGEGLCLWTGGHMPFKLLPWLYFYLGTLRTRLGCEQP